MNFIKKPLIRGVFFIVNDTEDVYVQRDLNGHFDVGVICVIGGKVIYF